MSLKSCGLEQCNLKEIENGIDLFERLSDSLRILPTGSDSLDTLLDTGIWTGEVTEIVGDVACGKTQLCLNIIANVLRRRSDYFIVYLDSFGTNFISQRLIEIITARDPTIDSELIKSMLSAILYRRVEEGKDVLRSLIYTRNILLNEYRVRLLIVDSIDACLYDSVLGNDQTEGRRQLSLIASELKELASEFGLAVIVVNHLVCWDNSELKPALGQTWASVPHTRIQLTKFETATVKAQLKKSVRNDLRRIACFKIDTAGICDIS